MEKMFMRVSEVMEARGCFRVLCLQIDPKTQQRTGKDRVCYNSRQD